MYWRKYQNARKNQKILIRTIKNPNLRKEIYRRWTTPGAVKRFGNLLNLRNIIFSIISRRRTLSALWGRPGYGAGPVKVKPD
jgi:hypothetical protein